MENIIDKLKTISFHREHVLKVPKVENLPTLEDADEHKLPAVEKLLLKIMEFSSELKDAGLLLQVDKHDHYPKKNLYQFTDTEYSSKRDFSITVKTNWLNPELRGMALHANFYFHLHVVEDAYGGRYEFADWITINLNYLNTVPMSLVSYREHIRCLNGSFFCDLPINYATFVGRDRVEDGLTFKTKEFIQAVEDACCVLQKIILRKKYLKDIKQ